MLKQEIATVEERMMLFYWLGSKKQCPKLVKYLESLALGYKVHMVLNYSRVAVCRLVS